MKENLIKRWAKKSFALRRFFRKYIALRRYANWSKVLAQKGNYFSLALQPNKPRLKVLIPTSVGSYVGNANLEGLIGVALMLRGAEVEFVLCDEALPACMACELTFLGKLNYNNSNPVSNFFCRTCYQPAMKAYQRIGARVHRYNEWLSREDVDQTDSLVTDLSLNQLQSLVHLGLPLGEHAYAGTLRFFARGDLGNEPCAERILYQYLRAAIITADVFNQLLSAKNYDCVVFNHGIYVPQGIIGALCRQKGIRIVNWNPAYRKKCFIFSHANTYHHTMLTEPVAKWENISWDDGIDSHLMDYLDSRRNGANDWIWFHKKPKHHVVDTLARRGVDWSKPVIGLLTSVLWDAALHYPDNAFPDMLTWVFETIDYFSDRTDVQLIIRIHPAEIQGGLPSRQKVWDEIKSRYRRLPPNVFVIGPESPLSTYAIMERCDSVIIYNTKTGIELAAMGIPVIVAGEAWIRNKGFSIDVSDPDEYRQVLDQLPQGDRMKAADTLRAKKYAYHFFFRRMIPLDFMEPSRGNPPFRLKLNSLESLKPGKSRGLDLICDGILNGADFIYDHPDVAA